MATLPASPPAPDQQVERAPRLGVLWVPDWPVAAAAIEQQIPLDLPIAIHDARGIVAASAPARARGIRRGMRRRSAQELEHELVLIPADQGRDVRAFEPVVQAVESVVADPEVVRPGMVLFAAAGPARYLGGEEALGDALVGMVAAESGAECQVGVSEGYLGAVLAAREGVLVPPNGARAFLAERDVRSLLHAATTREASAAWNDLVDLLRRLGLVRLGDVAAMRASDVAARFGELGVQARRLASGLDARRPVVHRPDPDIAAVAELDPPAARIDTAAFAAKRLAEDLQNRLLRRGAACARLAVSARTTDGGELSRTWRIEGAMTASELTDRVRWQLEGWLGGRSGRAPSAPLARIELVAQEISPAGIAQDGLWGRRARGEVQASRAALRVQGLLGPEKVLVPVREGGRAPRDLVRTVAWGDEMAPQRRPDAPWPGQIPPPLPTLIPAEPQVVELLDSGGRLLHPTGPLSPGRLMLRIPKDLTLGWLRPGEYSVTGHAGPWPVSERWWSTRGQAGLWLQVEVGRERRGAGVVLLNHRAGSWWLEGVHD